MNLQGSYKDWMNEACLVTYSRTFVKGEYIRTWHNQKYTAHSIDEAKNIVNEWNRIAILQHEQHPENGIWIYVKED